MYDLVMENMKLCIDEFYNLYNKNAYISKREFEHFIDEYKDLFEIFPKYSDKNTDLYKKMLQLSQNGYKFIDKHNKNFVDKKLKEYKDYFDHMFDMIDSNILLDEEQRKAIIIDEDYSLIIAGAGSGKTTTMAAKVKYLVEIKKVNPKNIILLAFTKKATEELDERINGDFKLGVAVLTFHKLGIEFIRKITKEKLSIVAKEGQYKMLSGYLKDIVFPNKKLLKSLMEAFPKHIHFDDKCLYYDNFDDYWKYYTDIKYEQCKGNLDLEIKKRTKNRLEYNKTINGEYVKSEGEVKIANYLYKNGINYIYEELYLEKVGQTRTYKPDFTIHDIGDNIYIEYYGLAKLHRNLGITSIDENYKAGIYKKRNIHKKYNSDLIELFGRYEDGTGYLPKLSYELSKRSIIKNKRSDKEIFYRLMETSKDSLFFNFLNLVTLFISIFKGQNYQKADLENMIDNTKDEKLKKQLLIIRAFYFQYEQDIRKNNQVDFADMINIAYRNMDKLKLEYKNINYNYVIIDEYQDISMQRYNFAKKLSNLFDAKIVAVGDDWQAIFSFSGSDIDLFTRFYELMGYAEIIKITKTYRNSQELIDVAGEFISKNTEQFQKNLISDKHLYKPIEIIEYNEDTINEINDLSDQLEKVLLKIYAESPSHNILLLGRYRKDIDPIIQSTSFKKGYKNKIIFKKIPTIDIEFLTIHSSKGLGYDEVILLNALNDTHGFPSKIEDHPIIKLIRNKEDNSPIEYPEERRLFYVAITRTKNKVYIMCPKKVSLKSDFIKEIISNPNVMM